MRPRNALVALSALALAASACISDDVQDLSSNEITLTAGLVTAADCDTLLGHLQAEGLERVGPYGFGDGYYGRDLVMEESVDTAQGDSPSGNESAPATTEAASSSEGYGQVSGAAGEGETYSGTNNQERDVDEPDLVKTDGKRLVIVAGQQLQVIDVTGALPKLVKTIKMPDNFWGGELFLSGDRAFVMASGWSESPLNDAISSRYYPGSPTSQITEVDLEGGKVLRTLTFEGSYLSARETNGIIRIVLTAPVGQNFEFLFPQNQSGEDRAEKANREVIEDSTIEQWLPGYKLQEGSNTIASGQMVPCDKVHIPGEFSGFGSMNVLTIDPDKGLELLDATSVLTTAQTIYASTDRLAVATARAPEFEPRTGRPVNDGDTEFRTSIHNFDITDNTTTTYVASGSVPGSMLSQYSLSEHNGYLRVATTTEGWWNEGSESESFITVLEEAGGELKQVGQVGGLGKGERITSVRFMGDVAYVVTFRQVDPLFTIDLEDPTNPRTLGELKIPGFSSYLHPVGDGILVGVGQDGTDEGQITGAQISAFDVSDLGNPTRVDSLRLGPDGENTWSDSPVAWNARAFTWWGPDRLAIVPVNYNSWNNSGFGESSTEGSDAVVVKVTADGKLTELGRVNHPVTKQCEGPYYEDDVIREEGDTASDDAEASFAQPEEAPAQVEPSIGAPGQYCWSFSPYISRTVIIDGNLFSISDSGVGVNTLDGLAKVSWIPFS